MQVGFALPVSGTWATGANMVRVARRAEELGYASVWTFQRLLYPPDGGWAPVYRSVHDPIVVLAHVAAVTERVRLGVAVVNLPFVAPILLAKQLTTLDEVSGGRLDAGLGLGWAPEEFEAAGTPYERRGDRADDFIRCLHAIWSDDLVDYDGEFYRVPLARVDPKPVQRPHPPLLLGGMAPRALRRAGHLADGWISSSQTDLTKLGPAIDLVKQGAVEVGRDPEVLRFIVRGVVKVRPPGAPDRGPLTGSVEEILGDLPSIEQQGVTEIFIDLNFDPEVGSPDVDGAASLRRAEEALEAFSPGRC